MSEPTALLSPIKPRTTHPRLWRNAAFIEERWHTLDDDVPVPQRSPILVSSQRWRRDRTTLAQTRATLGVALAVGDTFETVEDDLDRLALVALPFPKFSDGRSYSTARRIREAGFSGELRATGDVLLDQLPLMVRAGFDVFEIQDQATLDALTRGTLPAIAHVYQSAADAGHWAAHFKSRARQ